MATIRGEIGVERPWRLHQRGGAPEGDTPRLSRGTDLGSLLASPLVLVATGGPESPWSCFGPWGRGRDRALVLPCPGAAAELVARGRLLGAPLCPAPGPGCSIRSMLRGPVSSAQTQHPKIGSGFAMHRQLQHRNVPLVQTISRQLV